LKLLIFISLSLYAEPQKKVTNNLILYANGPIRLLFEFIAGNTASKFWQLEKSEIDKLA